MTTAIAKVARWVKLLRQSAQNSRASAAQFEEYVEPDLIEAHTKAARDFDEIADHLEGETPGVSIVRRGPEAHSQ